MAILRENLATQDNEIEILDAEGNITATYPSKTSFRWIYKHEMELLLGIAGFSRWQNLGGFAGRPLLYETDAMIVQTWTAAK